VRLKFFVDECLSPKLAAWLVSQGYDAAAARDLGRLGQRDDSVCAACLAEDRIIVTQNADDFRKLIGNAEFHPGLIILEDNAELLARDQMATALAFILRHGKADPRTWMVNRVVEARRDGSIDAEELP
jgi:predicted nuclease of predicted toxin-antitoxin system